MSGIALILAGSILYTFLKDKEMQQNNRLKAANQALAMTPSSSSNGAQRTPPPEIVFEMADKDDEKDLQEADAFLAQEEKRQRRAL